MTDHDALLADLTRRGLIARAGAVGLAALIAQAEPVARLITPPAYAAVSPPDALLQAFADTMIPGRKVEKTESGAEVDPAAIAGVDPRPGAVEADALALYHHPETGFDALEPAFLADLTARSLPVGGDFLHLTFDQRVQVCLQGLAFSNPTRQVWEAAAAVPFTAFCAAALVPAQVASQAVGYAVMGLPGKAPGGYKNFSYGRKLSKERTKKGYLP